MMNNKQKIILSVAFICLMGLPTMADEIHDAAQKGDLASAKTLLEKNPKLLNLKDKDGRTPLHWACRGVHFELLQYLVEKGADVNALDNNQIAPLHSLASRNHVEGVKFLLSHGAGINILDYDKHTPLHYAAMSNRVDVASILIKNGAKLELKDDYGRTPLLLCARERGGPEMTRVLSEGGADVNARDESGDTPLDLAAWRGKREVVDILLAAGAEIPEKGRKTRELLMYSASKSLENLFNKLLEKGANPIFELTSGGTLLHEAAKGGSVVIANNLVGKSLDINKKDKYGWTPMHYAAKNGRKEVIDLLIQKGANVNARTITGETPYNVAEANKQEDVKKLLIAKGADQKLIQFPVLEGDYMGQKPPGTKPEVFALGIASSIWGLHSSVVFSPDGTEAYWTPMVMIPGAIYSKGIIYMMKKQGNRWTPPQPAPFSGKFDDDVPFFSPDGKKLYFISSRPLPGQKSSRAERIWFMNITRDGWSEPQPVDAVVNSQSMHWQFSLDREDNLYFGSDAAGGLGMGDIYRAAYNDGHYKKPQNLGPAINTEKGEGTPYIFPDGKCLLFQRDKNIYMSVRKSDGSWKEAKKIGAPINSLTYELCPVVSPDGKYLFFLSRRDGEQHAWWVGAGIIHKLRSEMLKD